MKLILHTNYYGIMDYLLMIASSYFMTVRSHCRFLKIADYKQEGEYHTFYAYFQCKKRIMLKSVTLDKYGNVYK